MEKLYFIMTYLISGIYRIKTAIPIIDIGEDIKFYETIEEARSAAKDHPLCKAYGYEIFKMGEGEQ